MKRMGSIITALGFFVFAQAVQADWTPAKRLTWNSGGSYLAAIAIDSSNTIHIVWEDGTPGNSEIYYKKSTDGGVTWGKAKRLTRTQGWSGSPAIAIDSSDTIHVVWEDDTAGNPEIYYRKSPDGGTTWTTNQNLTQNSGSSFWPTIAVDSSDNLHVVWTDDYFSANYEVCYMKSTDGGATWSAGKRLTDSVFEDCGEPKIAVDSSDNLYIVAPQPTFWIPGSDTEICYKKSTDKGDTWTDDRSITSNSGSSDKPTIAVDSSNNLHVVWCDKTPGNYEIYYRKSTNGGSTWKASQKLTRTSGWSDSPDISVDSSNNVHVVWDDNTSGDYEIYYQKSTDGGATWSTSTKLTRNSGTSVCPAIAVDSSDNLHVVWHDFTPGNSEIYYRKFIQ